MLEEALSMAGYECAALASACKSGFGILISDFDRALRKQLSK